MLFFYKCAKVNVVSRNGTKNDKKILVCKIIALELGSTSSLILEQDTGHWQSICYQATLKFKISLSEVYSNAGSLRVMKNLIKMLS